MCEHCVHWFKVEEHVIRMTEIKILPAVWTGMHMLQWRICHSRGVARLECYIHNGLQLVKVGLIQIPEHHLGLDGRFSFCLNFNLRQANSRQGTPQLSHGYLSLVSVSDTVQCRSWVCPNFNDMPAIVATLLWICEPMSHNVTEELNIL